MLPHLREKIISSPLEDDPVQEFSRCAVKCIPWPSVALVISGIPKSIGAQVKARGCHTDRTNTARIWRGIKLVNTDS